MNKGIFITLEGVDGSGKSSQAVLIKQYMASLGYTVLLTKEPGSPHNPLGPELRKIMFETIGTKNMAPGVVDALFLADHIQHVEKVILPALSQNLCVISDRYSDSQFAYSSVKATPACLNEAFSDLYGPEPDLILWFTGSPELLLARAQSRTDGKQVTKAWNDVNKQRTIRDTYKVYFSGRNNVKEVGIIDGRSIEDTFELQVKPLLDKLVADKVGEHDEETATKSNI